MSRVIDELRYQGPRRTPKKCRHGIEGGEHYGCRECRDERRFKRNKRHD